MSLTVVEQIAQVLQTRLQSLLVEGAFNTLAFEVVRPPRFMDVTPRDMQIVIAQGQNEVVDELSYPGNPPAVARRQTFFIRCYLIPSERDLEAIDAKINTFAADVIKAVCTPSGTWQTFDGLAVDAMFQSLELFQADGGIDGVTVPVAVTYRTDENNPYNVRA